MFEFEVLFVESLLRDRIRGSVEEIFKIKGWNVNRIRVFVFEFILLLYFLDIYFVVEGIWGGGDVNKVFWNLESRED